MVHEPVNALLVAGLHKRFRKSDGHYVDALSNLHLTVAVGECLSVIGESGSGKSTLARILMGLETPDGGIVEVHGASWAGGRRRGVDGGVAVVLQDPADALDPRYKVLAAISEPLAMGRRGPSKAEIRERVLEAMHSVGLAENLIDSRVSRLSGGQQQRVGIARALVTKPSLLILDEPTSALDPSVQAQILDLLQKLQRSEMLSVLLITHDLAVAAFLGDRICVLRNGKVVELGASTDVWHRARHPYTRALMSASSFDARFTGIDDEPLPPSADARPEVAVGVERDCEFADVCGPRRAATCHGRAPDLVTVGEGHRVATNCITPDPSHHHNEEISS